MSGEPGEPDPGTTIWVSTEVKEWLTSLRVDPRQSYDSVLRSLRTLVRRNGKNHRNGA